MHEPILNKEELILQYIDGELNETDRQFVAEKIASDEDWECLASNFAFSINAVKYFGTAQTVKAIHAQLLDQNALPKIYKTKVVSFKRTLRIITTVAATLLIIAGSIVGYQFYQLSPDKVYNESFVSYQPSVQRGEKMELQSLVKEDYAAGDYTKAIKDGSIKEGTIGEDQLLVGVSYLQLGNAYKAISWLTPIAVTKNNFQSDAKFYLALSYIKVNDYDKAISLIKEIQSDRQNPYRQQFSDNTIRQLKMLQWK